MILSNFRILEKNYHGVHEKKKILSGRNICLKGRPVGTIEYEIKEGPKMSPRTGRGVITALAMHHMCF